MPRRSIALGVARLLLRSVAVVAAIGLVGMALAWGVGKVLIARAEPDASTALPPEVPGRLVDVDGHAVHVVEAGSGEPLVLLHGFAGSTFDWEEHALGPLAAGHRAVALDLLGMGFSARDPTLAYGADLWCDQVGRTMDALGIARATVAGHSLGGALATIFAARHPERVVQLVLVAPLVPYREEKSLDFFALLRTPGAGELALGLVDHLPALPGFSPAYHARAASVFRRRGTRDALLRYVRGATVVAAVDAALPSLSVPTLFVLGTADDTVPYAAQQRAATRVADALVLPVDGAGHWLLRDAPDRVVDAIRRVPPPRLESAAPAGLSGPP